MRKPTRERNLGPQDPARVLLPLALWRSSFSSTSLASDLRRLLGMNEPGLSSHRASHKLGEATEPLKAASTSGKDIWRNYPDLL